VLNLSKSSDSGEDDSMDMAIGDGEAIAETVVFLSHFNDLPDPRQRGKVMYPLAEVLVLCLLAVLAGAETITDIARFGDRKLDLLRRFRPFRQGTPAHDHLGDILATLDAEQFQRCFVAWVASLIGVPEGVVAIDGKTVRRSKGAKAAIHMVSAFAARQRLVLGQVKVADKANEIVAIPKLLDLLAIEGAVVTIDAMGCQRAIAQTIVDKKADYVLALKGNQSTLRDDVQLFVTEQKANDFKDTTVSHHQTIDGDHGRIETRDITVIHDIKWLQDLHQWPGLRSLVMIESTREIRDKIERETRLYITSLALHANQIGSLVRDHWAVENSLHWVMDMAFRDDECRVRTDHAPANFTTLKHMALNLIRRAPSKDSIRLRRKVASWDDDFLASIITK
jgi:predicted transposase YbfD/YdcC